MPKLAEVKSANSRFFNLESRDFHGDRKYHIKGDMLIIEFETELSNHTKSQGQTLYYIKPGTLDLVFINTVRGELDWLKPHYVYLMENEEVVRYRFYVGTGHLGAKMDALHD